MGLAARPIAASSRGLRHMHPSASLSPSLRAATLVRPAVLPGRRLVGGSAGTTWQRQAARPLVVRAKADETGATDDWPAETVASASAADPPSAVVPDAAQEQEYEEVVEYDEVAAPPQPAVLERLQGVDYKGVGIKVAVGVLGVTLIIALARTVKKYLTPRAKRKRTVNKNKLLVDKLAEYLPEQRAALDTRICKSVMFQTGFTGTEVFRKYLWFLLRERQFDQDAMADLVQLKTSLGLTDEQVAEAIKERSQRIYEKYGTLIMNTAGMTSEGATRKATGRALFSKLLYISESEQMMSQDSEAAKALDMPEIFGATERDIADLKIVSLYDVDLDKLSAMATSEEETPPDRSETGSAGPGPASA